MRHFRDREDAGRQLAERLKDYADRKDVRLFALPRGGVVVAAEVARELRLPLDVVITRKIGAPYNEEYAIGALAETGQVIWNEDERRGHDPSVLAQIVEKERAEARRRVEVYRQDRDLPSLAGMTAIIIDDGVATGLTLRAAIEAVKALGAAKIVAAVPHGAPDSLRALRTAGAKVIALEEPSFYGAVGAFYDFFPQVSDEETLDLLSRQ